MFHNVYQLDGKEQYTSRIGHPTREAAATSAKGCTDTRTRIVGRLHLRLPS